MAKKFPLSKLSAPHFIKAINSLTKNIWKIVNSPLVILLISAYLVSYYIPVLIAESQISYQAQLRISEEKYKYSQSLLDLYSRRLYLAKNYYWNYKAQGDFTERKDELWSDYADAVTEWNVQLVTNIFAIEKYGGKEKREYFEKEVQNNLILLHNELLNIRNGDTVDSEKIENLILNILDNRIYYLIYPLSGIS